MKLEELKGKTDPGSLGVAQSMAHKLQSLDSEFHTHHYKILDLIDDSDKDSPAREQSVLDSHDNEVTSLKAGLKLYIDSCSHSLSLATDGNLRKLTTRKLARLEKGMTTILETINSPVDPCLLHQHKEQLHDIKYELGRVSDDILTMDLNDSHDLPVLQAKLEKDVFDCGLKLKKLIVSHSAPAITPPASTTNEDVKQPKLDVPIFDGQLLNWYTFWEQFQISVHDRPSLSDAEKLVYLRSALKDGTAKGMIEGLFHSGEEYAEAVSTLKTRYDRPRLLHQTHICLIMEIAILKKGTGKELRRPHNMVQQRLRALSLMDYEPSGPFITSITGLKLDPTTLFEWQKSSQSHTEVPHYKHILEFLNLRAQASETSLVETKKPSTFSNGHFVRMHPTRLSLHSQVPLYLKPTTALYVKVKNTHFISVHSSRHFPMNKKSLLLDLRNAASIVSIQGIS